ncbi:hypothetical protein O181_026594 [Austropuccinia psidii MF-1]|uniref:Uncharacterized protein n=1 Tax=Austropuccinia psidii MF-1 TaxID=1389203 RepID=A0A9Q3H1S1_9BASI|nr:hypothetical protein [Austropuccinia psidii MF-1]
METVPKGEPVESEDDLKLYQQNNINWEDQYKQGGIFEDLDGGELSENTQRLAGLPILEPNKQKFHDAYEQICCFSNISLSSVTNSFDQNQEITASLTNDSHPQISIQEDIPEYEGEEDHLILTIIKLE